MKLADYNKVMKGWNKQMKMEKSKVCKRCNEYTLFSANLGMQCNDDRCTVLRILENLLDENEDGYCGLAISPAGDYSGLVCLSEENRWGNRLFIIYHNWENFQIADLTRESCDLTLEAYEEVPLSEVFNNLMENKDLFNEA